MVDDKRGVDHLVVDGLTVRRRAAATLAVQATIPAACTSFYTVLAATDDGVWFHDPSGIDPQGKGGHIRHIDPATNGIETLDRKWTRLSEIEYLASAPGWWIPQLAKRYVALRFAHMHVCAVR